MKSNKRKLYQIIGILLCLVMLIGIIPIQTALAEEGVTPLADELVDYEKVTSTDDFKLNSYYVITYTDKATGTRYALSTDQASGYTAEVDSRYNNTLAVDPDADYLFELTKNSTTFKFEANGVGLKINNSDGLFAASAADITLNYEESGYWSIQSSSRALNFSNGKFAVLNGTAPAIFEIWTVAPSQTKFIKLAYLEQIADFDSSLDFVIAVETEDGLKAIGTVRNDSWLYDIKPDYDEDGIEYINVLDTDNVVFNVHASATKTSGRYNQIKYWGFNNYGIKLKSGHYLYPQNASNTNAPLRTSAYDGKNGNNNSVQFEYGADGKIYLRGNRDGESAYKEALKKAQEEDPNAVVDRDNYGSYLGYKDGKYFGTAMQDSEYRLPVQIYVAVPDDAVRVEYLDGEGKAQTITYANPNGTLSLTDKVADHEHDGYTYTFVGWTMTKPATSYLSLENSANIFDYKNADKNAHIDRELQNKLGLIGDCDPDRSNAQLDLAAKGVQAGSTLKLYPIYAVHGFDSVVASIEADGTKIVGISDWKADPAQGLDVYYAGADREKWLGSIDVVMYKDGVEWVAPTRLYYRYHNDNTADLSIKFIWDSLLEDEKYIDSIGDLDPLNLYMSDHNQFPIYDQSGHYVIDAVYAHQGGSEIGLKYSLNWMTDHGGQLDNVTGGSTVQIFISTKYDVKYYLDDVEITEDDWTMGEGEFYTTPGTMKLFNSIDTDETAYKVRPNDELTNRIMDRNFVQDQDEEKGEFIPDPDNLNKRNPHDFFIVEKPDNDRDDSWTFSYLMHEYEHVIPLAKSPVELVPEGKILISKKWTLKDENSVAQSEHEWSSVYALEGKDHGTGNTAASYLEPANERAFAAEVPYTFHMYAYTGSTTSPETGDYSLLAVCSVLMIASLFGMVCLYSSKKRTKGTK